MVFDNKEYIMKKIFIISAFILLVCAGCGIESGQNNVDVTVLPGISVTPEPAISASAAPEPAESVSVTPEPEAANNYKINSDTVILKSGLKISDLESYFNFKRGELIQKLGNEYEFVDSGAEGSYRGQNYRESGMTLVFNDYDYSFEEAPLMWIDCDEEKLELNGLNPDMDFGQIQEKIGTGQIVKEQIEEDIWYHEYWYTLTYKIGNILLEFTSFEEDGSDRYWTKIEYSYG